MFFNKSYNDNIISYGFNIKFDSSYIKIEEFDNKLVFKTLLNENFIEIPFAEKIKFKSDNYEVALDKSTYSLSIKSENIDKLNKAWLAFEKNDIMYNVKIAGCLELFFESSFDFKPLLFNDIISLNFQHCSTTLSYRDFTIKIADATVANCEGIYFAIDLSYLNYEESFTIYGARDLLLKYFKKIINNLNLGL